jgi:hypothetical protein
METQVCNKCKKELNITLFDQERNRKGELVYRKQCSSCRLEQLHRRIQSKKERIASHKILIDSKVCSICEENKLVECFNKCSISTDGFEKFCKKCLSEKRKARKKKPISKSDVIVISKVCKVCVKDKHISMFRKAPRSADGYFKTCKECWKPTKWTNEKQKASDKKYRVKNKEKIKIKDNLPKNRIRALLRRRIRLALLVQKTNKNNTTLEYIGCEIEFFKKWMEFQFTDTMNWDNKSEWHIDHVIPCSSFNLENHDEQLRCFNWTNLRPCSAHENIVKSDKILNDLIQHHNNTVKLFLETYPLPTHPGDRGEGTD